MSAGPTLIERVRPFLRGNTIFGDLPDTALDALIGHGHTKKFDKGDVVCRRGERGDKLMVLLSGRIKITNVTAGAKEVVLNFLSIGDIIGEISALDNKERTADAIALEASEVFAVHARDLLPTLTEHPKVLLEIVLVICERLRSTSAIIEDNTLEMRGRVARGLLRLAQQHGRTCKHGIRLNLTMSQAELGGYLSLSRENICRQLARLRDSSLLKFDGSQIIITDERGLAVVAGNSCNSAMSARARWRSAKFK